MKDLKEMKEMRFNETDVILSDTLVRGSILPERYSELNRNIIFTGDSLVEGPMFGNRIEFRKGEVDIHGAVFTQKELYVQSDMEGVITFRKAVGSAASVVSRANRCQVSFLSDINAKSVTLHNAFVAGSIYADEIILDNCVVIGGVFATQDLDINRSIVGTFNSPSVRLSGEVMLLLPSAFAIERPTVAPGTRMINLSLADLGALYRGSTQSSESGAIEMNLETDELKSNLNDGEVQKVLRTYTVVGKVLAADLIDTDRFQNHFLLTAASLGSQLLKTYDMGLDANGNTAELTPERIRQFFFDILSGRIQIQPLSGSFNLNQLMGR